METVELEPTNVRCMEPLEEMISCSQPSAERRQKPQPEQSLNCPRCSSTNTKFCYYNNYSLSQPRYFCKTCRRYWTKGGTLRNVPVGGGCRKNRRPSTSKPVNKHSSNGTLETHSDLGIDHHGLSSYGQDMIFPFPMIQQYCGYGNGSGSEVLEHKPSPLPSISSAFNGVFDDVGFQNSSSLFYQPLEGVNSYFNQQRIEGGGRVFFPLEDQREDAKPNMFGGFDRKVVNQLTENSSYWNGMGGTWPQLPNYMP